MAKARMLHKSISTSSQVNGLSLPARLLFTWLIPHTDDEGKLKGNPEYVKALVVPMTNWSFGKITQYLNEIEKARLIYYWEQNSEWFIEFVKWQEHQSIRPDRFKPSNLPSIKVKNDNQISAKRQPIDNQTTPQSNVIESNLMKSNPVKVNINETSKEHPSNEGLERLRETVNRLGLKKEGYGV